MDGTLEERLLASIDKQCELLQNQARVVAKLSETVLAIRDESTRRSRAILQHDQDRREAAVQAWTEVKEYHILDDVDGTLKFYTQALDHMPVKSIFSTPQPWNTPAYRLSYRKLASFLDAVLHEDQSRPSVESPKSRFISLERSIWGSQQQITHTSPYAYPTLWRLMSVRYLNKRIDPSNPFTGEVDKMLGVTRTFKVTNLSPKLSAMVRKASSVSFPPTGP